MGRIIKSASRITLILMVITLCVGSLFKIFDPKDFIGLAGIVIAFFFAKKDGSLPHE